MKYNELYKKNGQIQRNRLFPSFLINVDSLFLHPICHLCTVSLKTGRKGKQKTLWMRRIVPSSHSAFSFGLVRSVASAVT